MLCARSFKNHAVVAPKNHSSSLSHTFPFTQDLLLRGPPHVRSRFSLKTPFLSRRHPSRTFSEAPHAPLAAGLKPFSAPFPMLSRAALTGFSESPPYPSHPLCRNDSRGEKGRFLCAVPETPERLPGAYQEGERKSSGSRRHLSRTLSEAPQTPLIHSNVSHLVAQSASEVLSAPSQTPSEAALRVFSAFSQPVVPQRFRTFGHAETGQLLADRECQAGCLWCAQWCERKCVWVIGAAPRVWEKIGVSARGRAQRWEGRWVRRLWPRPGGK